MSIKTGHCILFSALLVVGGSGLFSDSALAMEPSITALAFDPGGHSVVVASQAGLKIVEWPTLKPLRTFDTTLAHIHDVAFSPDGRFLAVGGGRPAESGRCEILRWPSGEQVAASEGHDNVVYSVAWRGDGQFYATTSLDRTGRIVPFRVSTGQTPDLAGIRLEGHSRAVLAACFLPTDGQLLTAGADNSIRVWNTDTKPPKIVRALDNHSEPVHDLAVRPQEQGVLPMVASVGADMTVRLWQPTIGRLVRFARLGTVAPLAVEWAAGGQMIAVACDDGHVRLIDPDTTEIVEDIPAVEGWAYALAVHPDGRQAVVGGENAALRRIELSTGQ
ncbi:MAG: WD40 repeat domain-containing protein [Fuerstiella sp.]|nr:WD40 repeat domain-containing protein [Fuerstiella sp.]MCP4783736.1 WD40 repeat domain-containing protein [Fuerstiella sp.]MCP4857029.1 WD40 repeat domain-containing protein [Fuerstiella sp.]